MKAKQKKNICENQRAIDGERELNGMDERAWVSFF